MSTRAKPRLLIKKLSLYQPSPRHFNPYITMNKVWYACIFTCIDEFYQDNKFCTLIRISGIHLDPSRYWFTTITWFPISCFLLFVWGSYETIREASLFMRWWGRTSRKSLYLSRMTLFKQTILHVSLYWPLFSLRIQKN